MSILYWIQKVLGNKEINLSDIIKVTDNNNNNQKIVVKGDLTVLNISTADKTEREELAKDVMKDFEMKATPLIIQDSEETLELLDKLNPEESLLNYFQDKIPKTDLKILEASLYLKALQDSGQTEKVGPLRQTLIREYGVRAQNISNLCTAGYFETYIKPLYKEMDKVGASESNFLKNYQIIVDEYPFAFFVNSNMNYSKVKSGAMRKIEKDSKYGLGYIRIHGIGKKNVSNIMKLIVDRDFKKIMDENPSIDSGQKYIIIQVSYKTKDEIEKPE